MSAVPPAVLTRKFDAAMLKSPAARFLDLKRDAVDTEARTVELAMSSETVVERWFGFEVLSHEPGAVRLGRLVNRGPVLMDHNIRDQVGVVASVTLDSDRVVRGKVR